MNTKIALQAVLVVAVAATAAAITWGVTYKSSPKNYSIQSLQNCLNDRGYQTSAKDAAFGTKEVEIVSAGGGTRTYVVVAKDDRQANKVAGIVAASAYFSTGGSQSLPTFVSRVYIKNNVLVFPSTAGGIVKACL